MQLFVLPIQHQRFRFCAHAVLPAFCPDLAVIQCLAEIEAEIRAQFPCRGFLLVENQTAVVRRFIVKFRPVWNKESTHMKTVLIRNLQNNCVIVLHFEDERIRPVGAGYKAVVHCKFPRHIIRGNRAEHKYKFVPIAGHPEGYPRRQNLNCIRFVHDIAAGG